MKIKFMIGLCALMFGLNAFAVNPVADDDVSQPITLSEASESNDSHEIPDEPSLRLLTESAWALNAHADVSAERNAAGHPEVWVRERPTPAKPTVQWLQITASAVETLVDEGVSYSPRANVLLWQATYRNNQVVKIIRLGQVGVIVRYRDWRDQSFEFFRADFTVGGATIQRNFKLTKDQNAFVSAGLNLGFHKFADTWGPLFNAELRSGVRVTKKLTLALRGVLSSNAPDRFLALVGPVASYDLNENVTVTAEVYYSVPVLYDGTALPAGIRFQNNVIIRLPQFREP